MEGAQPPAADTSAAPTTSLAARLTNIFVSPSEVFAEIKSSPPRSSNWIVPLLASMIVGIVYSLIIFSQPRVLQMLKDAQEQQFQKMVAEGKMKQQQVDQATAALEKFLTPTVLKIGGSVGATFGSAAMLFFGALVFWLVGKNAFHGTFTYMQAVEAVGVSSMITILGGVIAMLLAVIYGNIYITPGPVLFVSHFDAANKLHLALAKMNVISIWWIGVVAIGLARMSGGSTKKAAMWLYLIWAVLTFIPALLLGK